jgi:serine/threonine protein kinase
MRYGHWETIRKLGGGGQGTVYLVRDTSVNLASLLESVRDAINTLSQGGSQAVIDESALKLLTSVETYLNREEPSHLAALKVLPEAARQDAKALARLRNEVDILRSINHPQIVKVIDALPAEGWFVMPYYSGGTLPENLERFKGDPAKTLVAFRSLVDSVATLHAKSVVHRDIKPENIFVSGENLVLGDFGIVYFEDAAQTRVSGTYENVGSRDWMPPWAMGKLLEDVRPSFDVYSLGKLLWAMVSGRTKLLLWYWDRDEWDLGIQFPADERIPWINRLLLGSVREEEQHTWRTAGDLLAQIDVVLRAFRRGGQVFARNVNRVCRACGSGLYELAASETSRATLGNIGFNPSGSERLRFSSAPTAGISMSFGLHPIRQRGQTTWAGEEVEFIQHRPPHTTAGGQNSHVRVQRVDKPGVTETRMWGGARAPREASDDATASGFSDPRVLPARLGRDGQRRVRVGVVGDDDHERKPGIAGTRSRLHYQAGL